MERLTEGEILMIFVVAAVNIIHTTESKKGKKRKKSLVEELATLKVKIRSIKFAAGNEIKWSRRLQKLFQNTRKNCVGTYEFNCSCNHKINNKYERIYLILDDLKLPVTIRCLLTGAKFTDLQYISTFSERSKLTYQDLYQL